MREHIVVCQTENEIDTKELRHIMNKYVILYLEKSMRERKIPKEEQLRILDELIKGVRGTNKREDCIC